MFIKSDDKIAKKFALGISKLIDIQIQQEPFIDMNLNNIEVLRAKSCLAIYNFGYFIFFVNSFLRFENTRMRSIIDKTYNEFFESFKQNYYYIDILISEIVVNIEEQKEVILVSREWGINYEINVRTLLHNLFPMLYEIRIPKYLDKISDSMQKTEKKIFMPFLGVVHLFADQFLKEHNSEFAVKFDLIINLETFNRIIQMIKDNI